MTKAKKILIVGGVAGGASAAARARRLSEEAEIILFERGEYISFANCGLPYYIGGTIKDKDQLLIQTPEKMRQRFNIDIRTNSEVIAIDRTKQEITVQDKIKNQQYQESYDALILSPGANPIRPPIPGIDNPKTFTLRTIPDMDKINNFINTNSAKNAVVVGGGYIGLEMAENLRERGLNVTLVELLDQVMAPIDKEMAKFLQQELIQNGVNLKLETAVTGFKDSAETLQLQLSDNTTITCDFAILAIGVQPETALAKAADLAIGKRGGIAVDATMCTNDPNIYAIGDAIE
ncbi:MAG: FAD-dependent oxidoreductase, partial [Gammaproteobacteria bacterium]|nr:FAD-dependent oxidoreductase [Gammaproteobacteria bacterium]